MKMVGKLLILCSIFFLSGCFQAYSDGEDELCTIPTTNNPQVVPSHGSSMMPGMGGGGMPH